ncbi:hypothetical protein YM3MPS_17200 [Mycobacterium pseudoshottsii]|nr:hypothetical protein YM3MPS_17200 [Mycobacterium pseudoshottsii]
MRTVQISTSSHGLRNRNRRRETGATGLPAPPDRRQWCLLDPAWGPPDAVAGATSVGSDTGCVPFIEPVASREIYRNRWMVLREDDIRRPDGSPGIYGVVDKPAYALVIAHDGNRFRLVEQFRYPVGARRWEFPQGTAPDLSDVEPAELAARELREETGLRAASFVSLGQLDTAPGLTSQRGWVFLATGITEGESEREHEEQDMRSAWFARDEVEQMIRTGGIVDSQSIAAYGMFLLHRG